MTEVRLLVRLEESYGGAGSHYLKVKALPVLIEDGEVRWPRNSWGEDATGALGGLQATAQLDESHTGDFYGRDLAYHEVYSFTLAMMEKSVKALRRIHRHLERLDTKFGAAPDFAAFAGRLADAIGADTVGWVVKPGSLREDPVYRWGDVDGLRFWLGNQVDEWRERHGVKSEVG